MRGYMCPKDIEFAGTVSKSLAAIFYPPKELKPDRFYSKPLFDDLPIDKSVGSAKITQIDYPLKAGWVDTPWGPRPP